VNRTLTNILYFFVAVVIAKCIGISKTFFLAKILEPSDYGVWITMLLIISYAPIATFGTMDALLKQFPYFIGKGELARAKEVEDDVLGSVVLSAILVLIVGFTFHFFIKSQSVEFLLPILRVMFITSAFSLFFCLLLLSLCSTPEFQNS
jgi:O-antigen/teichoic acid export membrane protein